MTLKGNQNALLPVVANELNIVSSVADFDAVDANGISLSSVASLTSEKIVHRKTCVWGNFVQTLSALNGDLNSIVVVVNFVICK